MPQDSETWCAGHAGHDVVQSHLDKIATPFHLALTAGGEHIATGDELLPQERGEGVVGELGLLQAHHVGLPLVQPR